MPQESSQEAVFELLSTPATFGGVEVRRCDTHAAVVFLAGQRALKVKRAVRFPFLDYSTLEKRKAACAAELEVNRRFAPQLYRCIVSITREPNGSLVLDGTGTPVEWAVEMVRFDESQTLDHIADRGQLDAALPNKLAAAIAEMHVAAPPADTDQWLAAIKDYILQNTAAFFGRPDLFDEPQTKELDRKSRDALDRLHPLLLKRGEQGLVRQGHGDLHLGNIAVLDGQPVAFDAIEFDRVVASGDVLYDLAFLLMDLVERGLNGEANAILNGYFSATRRLEDSDALAALPFFMSIRAAIRAKAMTALIANTPEQRRAKISQSAIRYFKLALHLLKSVPPTIICVGGLSGTGKSILAKSLAPLVMPLPGALIVRSDTERKAMFGVGETERLPPVAYQPGIRARIYAVLREKARRIAGAGYSVVVDAMFAEPSERAEIEVIARETRATFQGVFLVADLDTRLQRIGSRGPDASDATAAIARQQDEFNVGHMGWVVIDASGTPQQTLDRVSAKVAGTLGDQHGRPLQSAAS